MDSDTSLWRLPPAKLKLASDEVDVWLAELDQPSSIVESLRRILIEEERDRADRFHFERDRNHFIVARGTLRKTLSRYTGIEPDRLRFCYTKYGKPDLIEEQRRDGLRFNLSHSHGKALIAVTLGREVGVDLEWIRPGIADEGIAERFFSAQEVASLHSLEKHLQDEAFFNCWTRKEAYIKAIGEGLSMPLDKFSVSMIPGEPAALLDVEGDSREVLRWSLRALLPAPGFAGAIIAEGSDWRLRCWQALM